MGVKYFRRWGAQKGAGVCALSCAYARFNARFRRAARRAYFFEANFEATGVPQMATGGWCERG